MVMVVLKVAHVQVFKEVLAEALVEALVETWEWEVLVPQMEEVLAKFLAKEVRVRLRTLVEPAPLVLVVLMPPWVPATVSPRAVPTQVVVESLAEVPAVVLAAVALEAFLAGYPAKEVPVIFPTMAKPVLLQVVRLLAT